jgi:hypothetical protein
MMFLLFKEVPLVDARLFEKQAKPLERQMSGISPISTGSVCHDLLPHKRGHLVITRLGQRFRIMALFEPARARSCRPMPEVVFALPLMIF